MAFTLIIGFLLNRAAIGLGHRFGLLDIPTSRRRHRQPTPIIGGLGVLGAWLCGVLIHGFLNRAWFWTHSQGILVFLSCVLILVVLGLVDDLRGLGPLVKLSVQIFTALLVLNFEPSVNALIHHWSETALGPLVWPMGVLWIVGITNAINLIDGLDGLAGGMTLLVSCSILVLSLWTGSDAVVGIVLIGNLIPAVMSFLKFNWHPARIFLGDNGSLPLGFLLGTGALLCRPESKSWIMVASVILMLGYPVLDMGQSVLRRRRNKLPLFKADRVHLHYRVMRIGLSVPQTALLLLSIGFFLQISALAINLMDPPSAVLGIFVVLFSICTLLFLVYSIEKWKVNRTFQQVRRTSRFSAPVNELKVCTVLNIDLSPILESNSFENRGKSANIVSALELLLISTLRQTDQMIIGEKKITIVFDDSSNTDKAHLEILKQKFASKINTFFELFNLTGSLSNLPISISQQSIIVSAQSRAKIGEVAS